MSQIQTVPCNDCPPSEAYNPKQKNRLVGGKAGAFGDVRNPLADELKDIELVRKTYSLLPIVPFYDNGDATLQVFRMLKDLSPTQGACINDIGRYVLGGEISIVAKKRAGWAATSKVEISESDKFQLQDFTDTLNPSITKEHGGNYLMNVAKGVYQNKKTYGNAFVRLNMVTVGRSRFAYIENIDTENVRYWATMPNEPKLAVISALWNYDYITRHPPEMVGVFPNMTEKNGVISTIFHDFDKIAARDWYGQPDSVQSIFQQFAEMQQGQYFTEGYASDFAGRVLFEYVSTSDDDDDDFDAAVESTFTNKAGKNKKRVIMRMRSPEDSPITVHEFSANREHEFHLGVSELTEKEIIKTHGWNKILMGIPLPGKLGGGGGAEFLAIYNQKNLTLLNPLRVSVMQTINSALSLAEEFITGKTDLTNIMSLGLADLFENQLVTSE